MSGTPSTNLDQWAAFVAVVDAGGYNAAAERLRKSQSAVSYAVGKLEDALGLKLLRLAGRRAVLTEGGEQMYRRARTLLDETSKLEQAAADLARGWEAQIRVAADVVFPATVLLGAVRALAREMPASRVEIYESVLSGTDELLLGREVDLVIAGNVPPGFFGESILTVPFVPVVATQHPLASAGHALDEPELRAHRQVVVRDSGTRRSLDSGWLGSEQRLTVSHFRTSVEAIRLGLGFAWLPLPYIAADLERGALVELALKFGGRRFVEVFLIFANRESAGPATLRLAELIRERAPLAVS